MVKRLATLDVQPQPVATDLANETPSLDDVTLISQPTLVRLHGQPVAAYVHLADHADLIDPAATCRAILAPKTRWELVPKDGMKVSRSYFGWNPASAVKRRPQPTPAGLWHTDQTTFLALDEAADGLAKVYERIAPEHYRWHADLAAQRLNGFAMGQRPSPWSSGVINGSLMGFHVDANIGNTLSAMVTARQGRCTGGELVLPGLGLAFACDHASAVLFDGKTYSHGVTATFGPGIRRSAVWYTRNGRWT